ncbi:hypothetical protein HK097_009923 [Rhizophlyctis rosea]|uniref:Proteasome assembly chaperone 3 n=1 Tax=Rhizophlyctis rosea TaxID=64517 RepID=A0AAD5SN61_9FUNG|nr:hypothetical protein HK097_009923 [Rhizophlyctis rosea]
MEATFPTYQATDSPAFPLTTRQTSGLIADIPTQIILTEYLDKRFLIITQVGKIGSLHLTSIDTPTIPQLTPSPLPPPLPHTTTRTLLGPRDDTLSHVYASHIAAKTAAAHPGDDRPMLLGLALDRRVASIDEEGDEKGVQLRKVVWEGVLKLLEKIGLW